MGFDATSGERNTTGLHIETQALTFAGSTAKPGKAENLEKVRGNSRFWNSSNSRSEPGSWCLNPWPIPGPFEIRGTEKTGESPACDPPQGAYRACQSAHLHSPLLQILANLALSAQGERPS